MKKRVSDRKPAPLLIDVSVGEQRLRLREGKKIVMTCAISTSKWGLGSAPGSNQTPAGRLRVAEKHGAGAACGTIFSSRQPIGRWRPDAPILPDDLITSRILWLDGLEESNATAYGRYIYIHGTNQEHLLGTPASHGCVRMKNDDVVALFDCVPVGTEVRIH